ncbi:MAG TPA: CvpA family protein [Candidatus Acidoferrales bacterium]|nr:CvpA family protein [Candidatus Acidoferrales bacterium]HXK01901.1 CvpA family protein [Verrucomicrobiae bacterium]
MNWLDVVLGLLVVVCMVSGFRRGLSRQVIGLVSGILALLLGLWFYGIPAAWFAPYLSSPALAGAAGFTVIFAGVLLVGGAVSMVVHRFLKVTGLSFFDHVLGAGFGLLRAALIAIAIVMGAMAFSRTDQPPRAIVDSRMAPYVAGAAHVFASMAPHDLKEAFRKTYGQVKQAWSEVEKGIHSSPNGEKKKNERQI